MQWRHGIARLAYGSGTISRGPLTLRARPRLDAVSWHHRFTFTTTGASSMATYIVFTRESTQDQGELDIYQSKVGETFKGHPVKILAAYGPQQVLEGEAPEGVVIVEFPSTESARAWYDSPAYQEVAQHRFKGARYRAVLVEGM
jgi:uncharacterized protein (DUF1330 family)